MLLTALPATAEEEQRDVAAALADTFADLEREKAVRPIPIEMLSANPEEALRLLRPYGQDARPARFCVKSIKWRRIVIQRSSERLPIPS